jgi:hypothetical protein
MGGGSPDERWSDGRCMVESAAGGERALEGLGISRARRYHCGTDCAHGLERGHACCALVPGVNSGPEDREACDLHDKPNLVVAPLGRDIAILDIPCTR